MTANVLSRIFTIEIGDTPTLTFEAQNLREAQELCHEQWLKDDLAEAKSDGAPLWDGKAKLRARMALPDESALFTEANNNGQPSDGLMLVYLIELDGEELPSIRAPFRRPGRCLSGHQRPGRGRPTRCCMLSSCSASSYKASAQAICANSSRLCLAAIRNRSPKVPSPTNCAACACTA